MTNDKNQSLNLYDLATKAKNLSEKDIDSSARTKLNTSKRLQELYKTSDFSLIGINKRFENLSKRNSTDRIEKETFTRIGESVRIFNNSNVTNILNDLGVTIFESYDDQLIEKRVPFLNNINFEFLKKGETRTITDNVPNTKLFEANRVSGLIEIDKGTLQALTDNVAIDSFIMSYGEKAISEGIFNEIVKQIEAKTAVTSFAEGDTAKAFNLADINTIEASLNDLPYSNKKYVVSNADSQKLKQTDSGFNSPLLQRGYVNDLPCYSHKAVSDGSLILADWSQVYVMLHYLNILVDPFTKDTQGKVLIRYNAYLDIDYDTNSVAIAKNFTA